MLKAGYVYATPDPYVMPRNKIKWHICVCPRAKLFLRINSKAIWPPWHMLDEATSTFLEHDSYVELTQLHFLPHAHESEEIGSLTISEAAALAITVEDAPTLTREHKSLVLERFEEFAASAPDPDAWQRFERAVDAALHTPAQHRKPKDKPESSPANPAKPR